MIPATRSTSPNPRARNQVAGAKKVTYSLPARLVEELNRYAAGTGSNKSAIVSAALDLYFEHQDRQELAAIYADAARDPLFQGDNEAVLRDFTSLDPDWDEDVHGET